MKVPKAKRLPSGMWRVQVQVNGQRLSITGISKRDAENRAAAVKTGMAETSTAPKMTVGTAIDRYIATNNAIFSPSTVKGYLKIRRNYLQDIMDLRLSSLTPEVIQRSVNSMARHLSPKTVRNAYGLLSSVLSVYRPGFKPQIKLPPKKPTGINIPDIPEIEAILQAASGTEMELPILLAMWMGLRESEIRGLQWEDISGNQLHVCRALVDGPNGAAAKGTKTYSGDRWLTIPSRILRVIEQQEKHDSYIVHLSGQAMYKRFSRLCSKIGVAHYRFHDLRHTAASVAMAAGVPNFYVQQRMGHKTDNMLKRTYLHTMRSKVDEFAGRIDAAFSELENAHKMHTDL